MESLVMILSIIAGIFIGVVITLTTKGVNININISSQKKDTPILYQPVSEEKEEDEEDGDEKKETKEEKNSIIENIYDFVDGVVKGEIDIDGTKD